MYDTQAAWRSQRNGHIDPCAPTFAWTCSYMGSVWFKICDETGQYEVELRHRTSDYERSISNYDDEGFQRNVVEMIGVLHRAYSVNQAIPDATFHAFNAWRLAEHAKHSAEIAAQPERYGDYVPELPFLAKAAARYENGWIITAQARIVS